MCENGFVFALNGVRSRETMARRARADGEPLFRRYDFHSVGQHQRQRMEDAINQADAELIRSADADELARHFADQFALEAPTLVEGAMSISVEETQVDVTGDFMFGAFGPDPTYVAGIRAEYYVPFTGERDMFYCIPSTHSIGLRPLELGEAELTFAYERPNQDVAATKTEFDRELTQIRQNLDWLQQDCRRFNPTLAAQARDSITARKTRLAQMTEGVNALGVPIRRAAAPEPTGQTRTSSGQRGRQAQVGRAVERYDIALSFAGENRAYVEEVAAGLKAAGVSVFYDAFETANLWGKNLIDHLAEIYGNSRFVVMFISKEYVEKAWTTHERKHAQERSLFAQEEYILPARFDDTQVPGMTTTVAYQDLRRITPQELVNLILAKLRR